MKPLLESQSYISEVRHISETDLPKGFINMDHFRQLWDNKTHLVNLQLRRQGFPDYDFENGGWLETDKLPDLSGDMRLRNPYGIINLTPRYRDRFCRWDKNWGGEACEMWEHSDVNKIFFVGEKSDYETLKVKNIGYGSLNENRVRYLKTTNALQVAAVLKGATRFSGNQSLMLAIRQSLGLPYRFEQAPFHVDTTQHSSHEVIINERSRRIHIFCFGIKNAFKR